MYDLEILPDFDFAAAGGIHVSQTHVVAIVTFWYTRFG